MADTSSAIFNKKAAEKLRSPDDLDKFVRVTNPSVWLVLAACIVLLVSLLAWGVFGTATTGVQATGAYVNGSVVCFLSGEDASKVHVGDVANVEGEQMEVSSISAVPLSRDEAKQVVISDYLVSTLVNGDWAYVVYFEGDGDYPFAEGIPLSVNITTERIAPIGLVFGRNSQ